MCIVHKIRTQLTVRLMHVAQIRKENCDLLVFRQIDSRNLISQGFWIPVCPFDSFFDRICSDEKVSSIGANCVADNWILTGVDWFESRLNGSVYLLRCFCDPLAGSKTLSTLIQKGPGKPLKIRGFRGVWCLRRHLWGGCYLGGFTIKWYLEYRWKVDASLENAHASEHIPM